MGIWIRSQKKTYLIFASSIWISEKGIYVSSGQADDIVCIGEYATKTRALEVLDMIQAHIIDYARMQFFGCGNDHYRSPVFEMPVE